MIGATIAMEIGRNDLESFADGRERLMGVRAGEIEIPDRAPVTIPFRAAPDPGLERVPNIAAVGNRSLSRWCSAFRGLVLFDSGPRCLKSGIKKET